MKQKVALVLSGGGARGIAHIGIIEELLSNDYEITSIAGTSMGALVGGVYALGKLEDFKKWICSLDRIKVFSLVDFTLSKQGLVKGDRVLNKMKDFIPDTNIESLEIPYAAVAADILNKKEVVFTKGSVYNAIRASISIPTVFTPVKTENSVLVDGGVLNNIPVNQVKRTEGDILIVANVNANIPDNPPNRSEIEIKKNESVYRKKLKEFYNYLPIPHQKNHEENFGYFDLINRTISLMTYQIAQKTIENYTMDMMINVSRHSCGTYDFYKAEEMVENGQHAARQVIEAYQKYKIGKDS